MGQEDVFVERVNLTKRNLEKLGEAKLVSMLMKLCHGDSLMKDRLRVRLFFELSVQSLPAFLQKKVEQVQKRWKKSVLNDTTVTMMYELRGFIQQLSTKESRDAFFLAESLLCMPEESTAYDWFPEDHALSIFSWMEQLAADWLQFAKKAKIGEEELVQSFVRIIDEGKNMRAVYLPVCAVLSQHLRQKGLQWLKESLETCYRSCQALELDPEGNDELDYGMHKAALQEALVVVVAALKSAESPPRLRAVPRAQPTALR